jgi:hypothetical protein
MGMGLYYEKVKIFLFMMFQEMASASRSEIYNNFDSYEDQLKLSHHSNISRHAYRNKMVHGNQWATSTEISVATRILQSNIHCVTLFAKKIL